MKYILFSFIALSLVGGGFVVWHNPKTSDVTYQRETLQSDSVTMTTDIVSKAPPTVELPTTEVREIEIQSGDTFSTIMEEIDVPSSDQALILTAVQDVYDFTKLQAGKLMHIVFAQDALASIDYDLNDDKKIIVENVDGTFVAKEEAIEYDVTEVTKSATIESSLFLDGGAVGLSDKTLVELAEIFQWDIDFATDI